MWQQLVGQLCIRHAIHTMYIVYCVQAVHWIFLLNEAKCRETPQSAFMEHLKGVMLAQTCVQRLQ